MPVHMPELPEVEVTRRSFAPAITGATLLSLRLGRALRWPLGCAPQTLVGRRIMDVKRRGKYLLLALDAGWLVLHLGMSGSLRFAPSLPEPGPHDHMDLCTSAGVLRLNDPRRFGAVIYADRLDQGLVGKLLGGLGMEPLDEGFDLKRFALALKGRSSAIKTVLLAGDVVVGVGNIYACEALFEAGIRPTTRACRLGPARVARLHAAIRAVLSRALEHGGSTLRDFSSADGQAGHFQLEAAVYGRAGQPCRRCARPVQRLRQGQRASYFCAHCQRP
ncbi:MAG: bifunctional DNA-formamidopyrimidine glycosylase/DNA-(apurinic or apyrimidinic site) lyase [Rhodoferax sp.]